MSLEVGAIVKGHFGKEGKFEAADDGSDEDDGSDGTSFYEVVSISEDEETVQVATLVTSKHLDFTIAKSDITAMYDRRDVRVPERATAAEQFGRWLESLGVQHPYMAAEVTTGFGLNLLKEAVSDRQWVNPLDALCDAVQRPFQYDGMEITVDGMVDMLERGLSYVYGDDPGAEYRGKQFSRGTIHLREHSSDSESDASDSDNDSDDDDDDLVTATNIRIRTQLRTALVSKHVQLYALFDVLDMLAAAAAAHPQSCLQPDRSGRSPKEIALGSAVHQLSQWAKSVGTLLGRYELHDGRTHGSATCLVILAVDVQTNNLVALKLMQNKAEWLREQDMRKLEDGTTVEAKHVVPLIEVFELEEDAGTLDPRLQGEAGCSYRFGLVMPAAKRDLSDALSHYRIAGRDRRQVLEILHQVATHLRYMNDDCGRIHGDLVR